MKSHTSGCLKVGSFPALPWLLCSDLIKVPRKLPLFFAVQDSGEQTVLCSARFRRANLLVAMEMEKLLKAPVLSKSASFSWLGLFCQNMSPVGLR